MFGVRDFSFIYLNVSDFFSIFKNQKQFILKTDLHYYIHKFTKLRRDNKNGGAPHKPILLLSLIEAYEDDLFFTNEVFIIPELVANFKRIWAQIVETNHHAIFALPFYHMKSEGFWELRPNYGFERLMTAGASLKSSFNTLKAAIYCAKIDYELHVILKKKQNRNLLRLALLERYFPNTKLLYKKEINEDKSFLFQDKERYFEGLKKLKESLDENNFQEDIFVRSGIFKREIPKLYNYACCISGMKITATVNASLVDACHIVPFSMSNDDTVGNGFCLSPNLHRAFDRGLVFINADYKVAINTNFTENKNSSFNISQFEGKKISLPVNYKHHPIIDNFLKHKEGFEI